MIGEDAEVRLVHVVFHANKGISTWTSILKANVVGKSAVGTLSTATDSTENELAASDVGWIGCQSIEGTPIVMFDSGGGSVKVV